MAFFVLRYDFLSDSVTMASSADIDLCLISAQKVQLAGKARQLEVSWI